MKKRQRKMRVDKIAVLVAVFTGIQAGGSELSAWLQTFAPWAVHLVAFLVLVLGFVVNALKPAVSVHDVNELEVK